MPKKKTVGEIKQEAMGEMKGRGILMTGPNVLAIKDGRKTQTRRVIRPQPSVPFVLIRDDILKCPYGVAGDRLYVREKYRVAGLSALTNDGKTNMTIEYAAGGCSHRTAIEPSGQPAGRWYPSIHMPKWASRLWLEITDVRVERVQDISEEDAIKEGCKGAINPVTMKYSKKFNYELLWDSINGTRYPWKSNYWVRVISFKRVGK